MRHADAWGCETGGSMRAEGISWYVRSRFARTPLGGSCVILMPVKCNAVVGVVVGRVMSACTSNSWYVRSRFARTPVEGLSHKF